MLQYNKEKTKIINLDYITREKIKEHDLNWPQIPDHPFRI